LRQPLERFALTKSEISALRHLSERALTISELAATLGKSTSLASHITRSLQGKGFVQTQKKGTSTLASIAQNNHAQALIDLIKNEPGVPWEKVLTYSAMNLLFERFEHLDFNGLSRSTRWRATRNLAAHGMLSDSSRFASSGRLAHFLDAYGDYVTRAFALEVLPSDAAIIWSRGYRFLFRVGRARKLPSRFLKTAVSALPSYGVQLVSEEEYYFYAKGIDSLSLEDVIIHTLLVDPTSQTFATYAIIAILKNSHKVDFESLMQKAREYGIESYVGSIKRYIDSKGGDRSWPLPPWEELKEQALDYGVEL